MTTLADKAILSGADNHPPMLEKDIDGPLIWPLIEENGVSRPKKYFELSATEAIQADCDIKATNIILQGLPPEVYALVSNHKVAKELWERIQLLMQGTSLTKQRKERSGRQTSLAAGTTRTYTPGASGSNSGKQRTLLSMANLSHYGLDALAEVHNHDNMNNNMINQVVQAMPSSEQSNVVNHSETKITSDSNIIPYSHVNDTLTAELERYKEQVKVLKEGQNVDLRSNNNVSDSSAQSVEIDRLKQTLSEHLKEKESLIQTVTLLKNDFKKEESRNIDREIALEKKIKQLDNIVFKRDQSAQTVHMLTKPQFFYDHTTKQALGFQNPFYLKKAQQLEPKLYDGKWSSKKRVAIGIPEL
ncbi:hypothetical protein Tco_1143444 [Tanacetum coccineum]